MLKPKLLLTVLLLPLTATTTCPEEAVSRSPSPFAGTVLKLKLLLSATAVCLERAARHLGTEKLSLLSPMRTERATGQGYRRWTGKGKGKGKETRRGMFTTGAMLQGRDRVLQGERLGSAQTFGRLHREREGNER